MLEMIIGIVILAIILYVSFKILGNVALGLGLIVVVFIASYLILGSLPDLQQIPIVGKYIPQLPSTTGEVIAAVRNVFYGMKVLSTSRDSDGRLMVTVANTGRLQLSGFKVFVDGVQVKILNTPQDPLSSGKVTTMQLDWTGAYSRIDVKAEQTETSTP